MKIEYGGDMVDCNALTQAEPALPAGWYYDEDHHRRELDEIWFRNWVYVCRASAIAEPLAFQTLQLDTQNIVVVRTGDGSLQAYHNTCRHRGSVLCDAAAGKLGSPLIVCPYHQWSYAADDGRLVQTSSFSEPAGFHKDDYSLHKVAVAEWRGCVFVKLDEAAVFDEATAVDRPPDVFDRFPLASMVVGETWRTEIRCNWKSFWENFNECLHCPNVHPELSDLVPLYSRRITEPADRPDWREHAASDDPKFRGGLRAGAETWSTDGRAQGHVISTLADDGFAPGQTYASIWPSVFIGGFADHMRIVRLLPLGPERMELRAEWLFEADTLADPDYDTSNVVDFARLVMEQDGAACELNQRGIRSRAFRHGVLMPEEYELKRFHDWVRACLVP